MNAAIYFFLIFAATGLLLILWALKSKYAISNTQKPKKKNPAGQKNSPCPLCNSILYAGENLTTRIYEGMEAKEQRATIHGCPYCFPVPTLAVKRTCPVCHKTVPPNGHLDAFLFIRDTGKRHIHITGCTECHKQKAR